MGLFDHLETENVEAAKPLAARMRPRSLDEFVGQEHFLGEGKLLRRILAADRLSSAIFYGPPGCGKTSLAEVIASQTQSVFARVNAASVGVKEVRELLAKADDRLKASGERTLLFVDELHHCLLSALPPPVYQTKFGALAVCLADGRCAYHTAPVHHRIRPCSTSFLKV